MFVEPPWVSQALTVCTVTATVVFIYLQDGELFGSLLNLPQVHTVRYLTNLKYFCCIPWVIPRQPLFTLQPLCNLHTSVGSIRNYHIAGNTYWLVIKFGGWLGITRGIWLYPHCPIHLVILKQSASLLLPVQFALIPEPINALPRLTEPT